MRRIERFLAGNHREVRRRADGGNAGGRRRLDFERAGRLKARIDTINSLADKQHAVSSRDLSADVVGFFREETVAGGERARHPRGTHRERQRVRLEPWHRRARSGSAAQLPHALLRHHHLHPARGDHAHCPRTPRPWGVAHGQARLRPTAPGALLRPAEGGEGRPSDHGRDQRAPRSHALQGAHELRRQAHQQRASAVGERTGPGRAAHAHRVLRHLHHPRLHTVASMVVFTNGKPDKNQYRRFKIKTPLDEANDFLSMQEVMRRRYAPERLSDERFGSKPDLIILDGGKPQLSAALEMFERMGIDDIAIAVWPSATRLFVPWQDTGTGGAASGSASLYLVKQVRDEAQFRFAITFHRELRGKGMTASILDDVTGMGPVRKKALLKHFVVQEPEGREPEDIKAAKVIPEEVAEELVRVLAQYNERKEEKEEQLAEETFGEHHPVGKGGATAPYGELFRQTPEKRSFQERRPGPAGRRKRLRCPTSSS